MSIHAQDIILNAFVEIGVYSQIQTMTSLDANFGLGQLNEIISQWQQENLFCQQLISETFNIAAGTSAYTIGPNGSPSLTAPRPNSIALGAGAASCTITAGPVTSLVNVVSAIEWQMIESISPGVGTPDTLFYDPSYPMGVINLAPTPNAVGTVTFSALQVLSSFADLNSTAYTPAQGVQKALENNLALSLMPGYRASQQPSARLVTDAAESKYFLRWGPNIVSRAMLNRRMISTGQQPPPPAKGE